MQMTRICRPPTPKKGTVSGTLFYVSHPLPNATRRFFRLDAMGYYSSGLLGAATAALLASTTPALTSAICK